MIRKVEHIMDSEGNKLELWDQSIAFLPIWTQRPLNRVDLERTQ